MGGVRCKVCAQKDCNYMKSLFMKTDNGNRIHQNEDRYLCKIVRIISIFSIF